MFSFLNRSFFTALSLLVICTGCDNKTANSSSHPPDNVLDETLEVGTDSPDANTPNDLTLELDDISSSEVPDVDEAETSDRSWGEIVETRSFDPLEDREEDKVRQYRVSL